MNAFMGLLIWSAGFDIFKTTGAYPRCQRRGKVLIGKKGNSLPVQVQRHATSAGSWDWELKLNKIKLQTPAFFPRAETTLFQTWRYRETCTMRTCKNPQRWKQCSAVCRTRKSVILFGDSLPLLLPLSLPLSPFLSLRFVVKNLAWKWAEEREYEPKAVKFKDWAGLVSARNLT